MLEDRQWLAGQLALTQETSAQSRREFSNLSEDIDEIAGLWADNCARDMKSRYLSPAREHAELGHAHMQSQAEATMRALTAMSVANEAVASSRTAAGKSHEAADIIEDLFREIATIERTIDFHLNAACNNMNTAAAFLSQAEQAGNAAPPE